MHIHILGICGTFMAGIAQIARAAGHTVTGSDKGVYPPMSEQLAALDIDLFEGYDAQQLDIKPDLVIVGNVMARGVAVVERMLNEGVPYLSGPQWLYEEVLKNKWVLAVSGTHGKTTTTGMLTWILQEAGLDPSFLIGGVANNFPCSAKLTDSPFFVIEADEYDTAFFDKRSKFVHYHPRTLIINNLEFDHADIFPDLSSIKKQFHHLLRIVPSEGKVIVNATDKNISEVLGQGCWSLQETFSDEVPLGENVSQDWVSANVENGGENFDVCYQNKKIASVSWSLIGRHNINNALAAIAAARHVGVTVEHACEALKNFKGLKRRLELLAEINNIRVYDDFAHHPTAIETTLLGLRERWGDDRLLLVVEMRSNTMRMGVHNEQLLASLSKADEVWLYMPETLELAQFQGERRHKSHDVDEIVAQVTHVARAGDHVVIMSNGGFQGLHARLLESLRERSA